MDEIKERLTKEIRSVKEFVVAEDELPKFVKKRKNWSAPGIDGMQNYWWKRFTEAQKALCRAFQQLQRDSSKIPNWFPLGRTVLLPKEIDVSNSKLYRPTMCLNTSYEVYTGLTGKHLREHAYINGI